MNWLIKASLQRTIGMLPLRRKWYALLQNHVSGTLRLSESAFEARLEHCCKHVGSLRSFHDDDSFQVFELGTGWFPTIPVGMYLCGAKDVWTCDIEPLLRSEQVRRVLQLYLKYFEENALQQLLPHLKTDRIGSLRSTLAMSQSASAQDLLEALGIHAFNADAQRLPLATSSVDFIESNAVLEYIPRHALVGIFKEFLRILRPSGVMSHHIDLSDEYAYFDGSLSPFNFLRFSDPAWKVIQNPFTPLTRLRIADYRELLTEAGFVLTKEDNLLGRLEDLQRVPLAQRFRAHEQDDLLVLFAWLTATGVPVHQ